MYLYVESRHAFTQSFTTILALGGLWSSCTCTHTNTHTIKMYAFRRVFSWLWRLYKIIQINDSNCVLNGFLCTESCIRGVIMWWYHITFQDITSLWKKGQPSYMNYVYHNWQVPRLTFRCVRSISYGNTVAPVCVYRAKLSMGMAQSESFENLKWQFSFLCPQLPS